MSVPPPAAREGIPIQTPQTAVVATSTEPTPRQDSTKRGVDLNTATVDELNGLGAGLIGRAIVRGRPYRAADELIRRQILSRPVYERIRDRVAVEALRD